MIFNCKLIHSFLFLAVSTMQQEASLARKTSYFRSSRSLASNTPVTAGWCVNYQCDDVPVGLDTMYAGSFQPTSLHDGPTNQDGSPYDGKTDITNRYVTFGGAGVFGPTGSAVPTADIISQDEMKTAVENFGATGLDFDLEASLDNTHVWQTTIDNAVALKSDGTITNIQVTCFGSNTVPGLNELPTWAAANPEKFDTIALMLYGGSMTGAGWEIPKCQDGKQVTAENPSGKTWEYINKWLESGIPHEKIILGMTSTGLEQYHVDFFQQIVDKYSLGGISFWNVAKMGQVNLPTYGSAVTPITCPPAPAPITCPDNEIPGDYGGGCACYDVSASPPPCSN